MPVDDVHDAMATQTPAERQVRRRRHAVLDRSRLPVPLRDQAGDRDRRAADADGIDFNGVEHGDSRAPSTPRTAAASDRRRRMTQVDVDPTNCIGQRRQARPQPVGRHRDQPDPAAVGRRSSRSCAFPTSTPSAGDVPGAGHRSRRVLAEPEARHRPRVHAAQRQAARGRRARSTTASSALFMQARFWHT